MTTPQIIYVILLALSILSSILAWVAKLRWSKEFRIAKEAEITSLKQQVETLKDITPIKLKEYLVITKELLEERITGLEEENRKYKEEADRLTNETKQLTEALKTDSKKRKELEKELERKQKLENNIELNNNRIENFIEILKDFNYFEKVKFPFISELVKESFEEKNYRGSRHTEK